MTFVSVQPPPAVPVPDDVPVFGLELARVGQPITVDSVVGDDDVASCLIAAGLWPGTAIERIGAAPFGDPLLFRVHGYRLALRRSEAARVMVRAAEAT